MTDAPLPTLRGLGVLVTRPAHQAEPLCRLIEQHGGVAIRYPTLAIGPPPDLVLTTARARLARLADYDLAIFTSVNAVNGALPLIREQGDAVPPGLEIAAIGAATARALAGQGIAPCLQAANEATSEGLLALDRLQSTHINGQRVLMVRGVGGRTLLADTLRDRGARVEHAVVYQRQRPLLDPEPVLECWARGAIGAVTVTSDESLRNLFDMLGAAGQDYLRATPLIVVSARTRQTAAEYGCRHLLLAQDASDAALTAVLLSLTAHPSSPPGNTI